MRIIGIDPGLATVGVGILVSDSPHHLQAEEWLTIRTKAGLPASERLAEIFTDLTALLQEVKPDLAVVERLYFETNVKTAMDVSQARGIILLAIELQKIPLLEATPLQLKQAITGDGKADKRQVQEMLVRLLQLKEIPQPDDAADALALAVYGAVHRDI
ncbi:MAG: crossover junction endodeoxyribonuclease RuvC [Candidatus Peribacteria bacterium]|nr:crossover junction endodeoxyribonuclease RuvC [Candidatus Peribacteria bacterium]